MKKSSLIKASKLKNLYDPRTTAGVGGVSFELLEKECLGVIGPSGSGKSTLLKCLAGEIKNYEGSIEQSEKAVIGYVAQNDRLEENLTVFENLAREIQFFNNEERISSQVRSTLSLLEITNEIDSFPREISGGQYQRAVIGKALVRNPNILLLDEPFGHLDERLRLELMMELFPLFKAQDISLIWVTHQNHEALAFSDRVMILNHGRLQLLDTPYNCYFHPKNLFSAQFLGHTNTVIAKLIEEKEDSLSVNLFEKDVEIKKPRNFKSPQHDEVLLIIRASQIFPDEKGPFKGKIIQRLFLGEFYLCEVEITMDHSVWMNIPAHEKVDRNQDVRFNVDKQRVYCLSEI